MKKIIAVIASPVLLIYIVAGFIAIALDLAFNAKIESSIDADYPASPRQVWFHRTVLAMWPRHHRWILRRWYSTIQTNPRLMLLLEI